MPRLTLPSLPLVFVLVLAALAVAPSRSRADMPDATGLVDYGFKGLSLGVELGLSMGYIATGPVYRSEEWKKLVLGMGIGAIVGMVGGIVVSVVDATGDGVPMGYFVLRDAGYGTLLGATMGAVIGMLLLVNDGTPKDILKGAAFGTLFGAAAGAVYGVVEGMNSTPPSEGKGWDLGHNLQLGVSPTPLASGPGVAAHLSGVF